jgi:hypothetical protein
MCERSTSAQGLNSLEPIANASSAHDTVASIASPPNVRDDRDPPPLAGRDDAIIAVIWGNPEQKCFLTGRDSPYHTKSSPSGSRYTHSALQ